MHRPQRGLRAKFLPLQLVSLCREQPAQLYEEALQVCWEQGRWVLGSEAPVPQLQAHMQAGRLHYLLMAQCREKHWPESKRQELTC